MTNLKAVFITYNQAYHPIIIKKMKRLGIYGYTNWTTVYGQGSNGGEPHLGSHAWPTSNSAIMAMVDEKILDSFLKVLKELDEATPEQGLRAFVWNIESYI